MANWSNDNFTDTDLTLLTAHVSDTSQNWSQLIGSSPQIFATAVSGKSLLGPGPGGGYSVSRLSLIAPSANVKIPFGYHIFSIAAFAGLALRLSGTGSGTRGYAGIINTATSKYEIWKIDSTGQLTGAALATSAAVNLTAGDSGFGEFGVDGNTLKLVVNGVTVNYTDATSPITAAGYVGTMFAGSQGTGIFLDFVSPQDQAASQATAATLSGPAAGNVGAESTVFTVGANGTTAGTVRHIPLVLSPAGDSAVFTPAFLDLASGATGTFTVTASSNGVKSIGTTNNGGLTAPTPVSFTAVAAGAPVMGAATLVAANVTSISVSALAATGGGASKTYQWHRSTTANFTPGAGTVLAGATALTLADSSALTADTPYYYICRVTDGGGLTADSNQVAGILKALAFKFGGIGDSITFGSGLSAGQDPCSQLAAILRKTYKSRETVVVNAAVPGTRTSQWISGQPNLISAKAAFAAAGVTHVHGMFGANDAATGALVAPATYRANLANIAADLNAAGLKFILSYPTYIPAGANNNATTAASVALAQAYQAQIDSLIDGVNILRGDTLSFNYFMDNLGEYQSDMTHPTAVGALSLATMWGRAIDRAVLSATAASGPALASRTVTVSGLKLDKDNLASNLSNLKVSFRDAASPELPGEIRYQSAAETTDAGGNLTFACNSSLASGAYGWIDVKGAGLHYCAPVAVA